MANGRTRTASASKQNALFLSWVGLLQRHDGDHRGVIGELEGRLRDAPRFLRSLLREELGFAESQYRLVREADWERGPQAIGT